MPAPLIAAGLKAAAKPLLKKAAGAMAQKVASNAAGKVADKIVPPQANKGMKVKKKAAKTLDRFATKQEGKAAKSYGKAANMSKKAANARTKIGKAVKKEVASKIGDVARGKVAKAKSARSAAEKLRKAENGTKMPKKKGKIKDASGKVVGKYKNRGKIGKFLTGQDAKASFKEGGKYDPRKEAMKKGLEAKIKKAKGTPAAKPLVDQYRKLTGSK